MLTDNNMKIQQIPQNIKAVYDRLADDESRTIFESRLSLFLNGDPTQFVDKIVVPYWEKTGLSMLTESLRRLQQDGREMVFYGYGKFGHHLVDILKNFLLTPDFIADRNYKTIKAPGADSSITIISPDKLIEEHKEAVVIIATSRFLDEIKEILFTNGFSAEQVIDTFAVSNNLAEKKIKREGVLSPVENEIFVDGGVLDGGSIKEFIEFCGGTYKKIYGFEPDLDSCAQSLENIRRDGLERVKIVGKGLWSAATTLSFSNTNDGASRVDESGSMKIEATTIDDTVGDDKVTLIKMDIEGAELEALKGAANTIRRDKPRLVICLYHKPEDILEIPLYIHSLVPEYTFYIRHESLDLLETVLYGVIEK